MILTSSTSNLLYAEMRAAGAGGTDVEGPGGRFNPMKEFAAGIAAAVAAEVTTAEASSRWIAPPTGLGVLAGLLSVGVPPLTTLTDIEIKTLARVEARNSGWSGRYAHVLFEGVLYGLRRAFHSSRVKISSVDPLLTGLVAGTPVGFAPTALSRGRLSRSIAAQWTSNPLFEGSKSSYREPVALACARLAAAVWARVTPLASGGTGPPAASVAGSFTATYL